MYSVNVLVIPIAGLTSTTNSSAYILGRDKESDKLFRARILSSQQQAGTATVPAIEDAISGVDGVTTVRIIENRSFIVDGDGEAFAGGFAYFVEKGSFFSVIAEFFGEAFAEGVAGFLLVCDVDELDHVDF